MDVQNATGIGEVNSTQDSSAFLQQTSQFSTFYVAGRLYGIDVMQVQEVTKSLPMTQVPLSPNYVYGLINLRGQIATAIGLRELFGIEAESTEEEMNIVCRMEDLLVSVVVDRIGDVMIVENKNFEETPNTIPNEIRRFMQGVYKIADDLLSVIDIEKVIEFTKKQSA